MPDTTSPTAFGKVAVVMGGWSAERDVSLMSGQQVLDALVGSGVDAHAVDAGRDVGEVLARGGFDRAFLILHGRGGEDGTVQAALELAGIPYTGSGVLGSALAMDKARAKQLCRVAGIPTPIAERTQVFSEAQAAHQRIAGPVVVKPVSEGSSIGVSLVHDAADLESAWTEAHRYGDVLVEAFMPGAEVTAAVLEVSGHGLRSLPLVTMQAAGGFYDYDAKYLLDDTEYQCPANIPDDVAERLSAYALQAFQALGCRGWGRVDFMLDAAGEPQFIECNTAPGMTSHSLMPMAAAEAGIDFASLCLAILASSVSIDTMQPIESTSRVAKADVASEECPV
jgi:D-alanine-D-alanine ligase